MPYPKNTPTCFLIGSDTLLAQCGEILLERGVQIKGVITQSERISSWARSKDIVALSSTSDYVSVLEQEDFDYLFAITHLALIPEAAIRTPDKLAINFHDGPLPAYAGLNTPMWAIINGETKYGISWHVMSAGIDKGDILLQQSVAIADDDTALSLNTKCFAAAIESFPILVKQLLDNSVERTPQEPDQRTYFSKHQKPDAAGVIDWTRPAVEIERLIRALDTGAYPNLLCTPKLILPGGGAVTVTSAVSVESESGPQPGEVTSFDDSGVTIQTADGALCISAMNTLYGESIEIQKFAKQNDLVPGVRLPQLDAPLLTELYAEFAKFEPALTNRFNLVTPAEFPQRGDRDANGVDPNRHQLAIELPKQFLEIEADVEDKYLLAAAFGLYLVRSLGAPAIDIACSSTSKTLIGANYKSLIAEYGFFRADLQSDESASDALLRCASDAATQATRALWLRDLIARQPSLRKHPMFASGQALPLAVSFGDSAQPIEIDDAEILLRINHDGNAILEYSAALYQQDAIRTMAEQFARFVSGICSDPTTPVSKLDLLSDSELELLLRTWNSTDVSYDKSQTIHSAFSRQVEETPDAIAVAFQDVELSYQALDERANRLACQLIERGVESDTMVGVYVERSIDLLVATLGVMKAGGAYVPLDPAFPVDRIEYMIADSAMPVIVTQKGLSEHLPETSAVLVDVSVATDDYPVDVEALDAVAVGSENLAYVIYTSGSTGKPKGVMIEHRNAINFFVGMDAEIPLNANRQNVWLAVTSLSFDISVLELFWTLTRGFKVVVHDEVKARASSAASSEVSRQLDIGLFMWGNDDAPGPAKYRLLMEGSKYFDANGFHAVWTPERHFHAFGGPYPNPSVTGAAVAAVTENIRIRSGSCVVPLHNPIRIAEEWAVVDNLSNGRVELSAASGWNPNDFVLRPESFKNNKQVMFDELEKVRKLWRGEKLKFPGPLGDEIEISSLPRPVQNELPCWVTTAGNPETWIDAGRRGFHVLTHLLGQTVTEVGEKIQLYRQARADAGFDPESGRVALMLHTFVGEDDDEVRELVREPMKSYLQSSMRLAMNFAWSFPAFKRPGGDDSKPEDIDIQNLSDEEVDTILNFAFDRYFETSGLFGTVDTCVLMLKSCSAIGVDEIACLFDFGVSTDAIMESLPRLKSVREKIDHSYAAAVPAQDFSFAAMVSRHKVTHMQCTPSMARMYAGEKSGRAALSEIEHLLLGGEALPQSLARDLEQLRSGTLTNMYGPTETTIWSTTYRLNGSDGAISIGRPIANTQLYVLDGNLRPVPKGASGELYIGGDGVARGYLNKPDLTEERFVANPFSDDPGSRIYATGDLVSYRPDALVDYIGRSDFQVKVRGYRIELGEIESVLDDQPSVRESAVIVKADDESDQRLVAFVISDEGEALDLTQLRDALRTRLPEYMVPNEFVDIDEMPRTPNGKLDRKFLQTMKAKAPLRASVESAPKSETEKLVSDAWRHVLKLNQVGVNENFFDIGGHSLLVVQLHAELKQRSATPISLTDLYQYPTIKSLSDYIASGSGGEAIQKSASRGARRRALRRRSA